MLIYVCVRESVCVCVCVCVVCVCVRHTPYIPGTLPH